MVPPWAVFPFFDFVWTILREPLTKSFVLLRSWERDPIIGIFFPELSKPSRENFDINAWTSVMNGLWTDRDRLGNVSVCTWMRSKYCSPWRVDTAASWWNEDINSRSTLDPPPLPPQFLSRKMSPEEFQSLHSRYPGRRSMWQNRLEMRSTNEW